MAGHEKRDLALEPHQKAALAQISKARGIPMSAVLAAFVEEYGKGKVVQIESPEPRNFTSWVRYWVPPQYDKALARAQAEHTSLAEVIRLRIEQEAAKLAA